MPKSMASSTRRSRTHREWWLVMVCGKLKHWFSLEPQRTGEAFTFKVNTFDEIEVACGIGVGAQFRDEMISVMRQAPQDFGLGRESIHLAYHEVLVS